jgi:hypothetical protein
MTMMSAVGQTEITLPGTRVFPESMTSTKDGAFILGSLGHGYILKIAKGSTTAEEWIKAGTSGLNSVLGVFADEKAKVLWVCSNKLGAEGEASALKSFDLKTGAPKGSYPFPGGAGFCNDIAVAPDGAAYIADTRAAAVFMLRPKGTALEEVAKDPKLAGADGLAFGGKSVLYVNSVSAGKLFRLDLGADGKSTKITELATSRPLTQPDGMRALSTKGGVTTMLLAEGAGRMSVVKVTGDTAEVNTIKELKDNTPAVTFTRGLAWVVEGKLPYRNDPKLGDPGTFKVYGVKMPK